MIINTDVFPSLTPSTPPDPLRTPDRKQDWKRVGAGQSPKCGRLESLNPAEAVCCCTGLRGADFPAGVC